MNSTEPLLPAELWRKIITEAHETADLEPILAGYLNNALLRHNDLGSAISSQLANKLSSSSVPFKMLEKILKPVFSNPKILNQTVQDIEATVDRDSACNLFSSPILYFKGFLSLQAYRGSHQLWNDGRRSMALLLQHRASVVFAVDIHPAATIGCGVMIDHATGLVIGETAVIEDSVSIMQSVTLGGTGKNSGDRHPKIKKGVLIGPGATILGNIEVGEGAMVAASSVVLKPVRPHTIVAGVPAVEVGDATFNAPSEAMVHDLPNTE